MIFNSLTFWSSSRSSWRFTRALLLVASEEDQSDDRIVPVLRRVEPAVRHPAVDLNRGGLGFSMDGPAKQSEPESCGYVGVREPRGTRLFQM
jgi:hypothetical protein